MQEKIDFIKSHIEKYEKQKRNNYDLIKKAKDILLKMENDYNATNKMILFMNLEKGFNSVVLFLTFLLASFLYTLSEEIYLNHINGFDIDTVIGWLIKIVSVITPIISFIVNYHNTQMDKEVFEYYQSELNELIKIKSVCEQSIKLMKKENITYDKTLDKLKKALIYLEKKREEEKVEEYAVDINLIDDKTNNILEEKVKIKRK